MTYTEWHTTIRHREHFEEWLWEKHLEADALFTRGVSLEEWGEGEALRIDLYRALNHA